jgi:KUP system potassium uptake protein
MFLEVGLKMSQTSSHVQSQSNQSAKHSLNALTLAALGIVFGDIGTSPLYALREAFHGPNAMPTSHENVLGILSLVVWSLIIVISIKYLLFVMRADNKGEGGVLALTSLAAPRSTQNTLFSRMILYLGLFGSALLFGDGVITPAISVLSAVEGLEVATPFFAPFVVPITIAILFGLFYGQRLGTAKIGAIFGPVILLWFTTLGALGIHGSLQNSVVFSAVNPKFAYDFFVHNGWAGTIALGAVFLVVTGGEALYADMGHLGRKPIQRAWFFVALPGLLLNYFGQGALLLTSPEAASNPFYKLAPSWGLYPLVILATAAAVIASQALITGVFSLTRQAVQLGYAPRVRIIHTSIHEIGQIYIPHINWVLFILTAWLVASFQSSSALAAAYGIAVATTMVITTILTSTVAYKLWKWSLIAVAAELIFFMSVDGVFLAANTTKILSGGWFPLAMGAAIFTLMTTWRRGREILQARLRLQSLAMEDFFKYIAQNKPVVTGGTAIYMTGDPTVTPLALTKNVKHNKCLHEKNIILTIIGKEIPHVPQTQRLLIERLPNEFYRVVAKYGFMETPDIQDILRALDEHGVRTHDITYFLGRETLIATSLPGMAIWREHLFAFMSRNSERATAYFNIPGDRVIEVGIQVEI